MRFNGGTADCQSHAHSAGLGGKKWLEKLVHLPGVDAHTRVLHGDYDLIRTLSLGCDNQLPLRLASGAYRFDSIQDEVENHLLQLDGIANDGR
jgi:hypothetical protein